MPSEHPDRRRQHDERGGPKGSAWCCLPESEVAALKAAAQAVLDCGVGNLSGEKYHRRVEAFDALADALEAES